MRALEVTITLLKVIRTSVELPPWRGLGVHVGVIDLVWSYVYGIKRTRGTRGYQKIDSTCNVLQEKLKDPALMNITDLS